MKTLKHHCLAFQRIKINGTQKSPANLCQSWTRQLICLLSRHIRLTSGMKSLMKLCYILPVEAMFCLLKSAKGRLWMLTLWLFNIAKAQMAHRNRWFSQRTKPPFMVGIFHGYVSHNQMVPSFQDLSASEDELRTWRFPGSNSVILRDASFLLGSADLGN